MPQNIITTLPRTFKAGSRSRRPLGPCPSNTFLSRSIP